MRVRKPPLNPVARKIYWVLFEYDESNRKVRKIEELFTFKNVIKFKWYKFKLFIYKLLTN